MLSIICYIIQKVTTAIYLGVTVDCHLDWKSHINIIANQVNAAQVFLRRNTIFCPTNVKIHRLKPFVQQLWNTQLLPGPHFL